MRRWWRGAKIPPVDRGTDRVVLDLNPGEPISGFIGGYGRRGERFHGWVELATKLERLRVLGASDVELRGGSGGQHERTGI